MQVVLSIQARKGLPSMRLPKFGSYNRQNKLYRAFRELGRLERTFATTLTTLLSDLPRDEELIGGETCRVQEGPDRNTISQ